MRVVPCGGMGRWTDRHDEAKMLLFTILQTHLTNGLLLLNPPKFSHISLTYFIPAAQTFLSVMQNHESHWPYDSNNTHLHTYNDISHQVRLIILGVHN
jgi:hypothetical protein